MRRSYISPEYTESSIYGTFNMVEESNFFAAKMLEIEDSIYISNQNIIYYQKLTGEQIDLSIESSLPSQVYSASDNMKSHQTLIIDPSQLDYQKDGNTKWILTIELKDILTDYLFATMKRYRTFEGISNNLTRTNDVNTAMKQYISNNVLNRYKFSKIDLYVFYKDLMKQNVLRYKNTWNPNIAIDANLLKKSQKDLAFDDSELKIYFSQEKSSSQYNFEYYFNILFEKI
jgi:hypothetical protein